MFMERKPLSRMRSSNFNGVYYDEGLPERCALGSLSVVRLPPHRLLLDVLQGRDATAALYCRWKRDKDTCGKIFIKTASEAVLPSSSAKQVRHRQHYTDRYAGDDDLFAFELTTRMRRPKRANMRKLYLISNYLLRSYMSLLYGGGLVGEYGGCEQKIEI